jgi:hypothetical protein
MLSESSTYVSVSDSEAREAPLLKIEVIETNPSTGDESDNDFQ